MTEEKKDPAFQKNSIIYSAACYQFGFNEGSEEAERLFVFMSAAYIEGYREMHGKIQKSVFDCYSGETGFNIVKNWNERPREAPSASE